MLTEWFLHAGRVTVEIDDDHARTGNQTVGDYDFLDETLGFLNEKVQEWLVLHSEYSQLVLLHLRILVFFHTDGDDNVFSSVWRLASVKSHPQQTKPLTLRHSRETVRKGIG